MSGPHTQHLRVALVCDEYPPGEHGGIGTATQLLARALVRAGHAVRVVGVYGRGTPLGDHDDEGVAVRRLPASSRAFGWIAERRAVYRTVAGWARAGEIDVVEVPDYRGSAAGWPALVVPVVARVHGSLTYIAVETGRPSHPVTALLERESLRRADAVVACSAYAGAAARRCLRLRDLRIDVVHNFAACAASPETCADARASYDVVFSGSLLELKGVRSLCAAWPAVLAGEPRARLHLFGKDGRGDQGASMRAELERRLPASARASVYFHGHVARAELLAALARARAAIFPSYVESFALAPMEAMAAGCPTIYTRRGPGPELVVDGDSGLLVDPGDPTEIAAQVLRLLHDDALAARLGAAGRRRIVTRFSEAVLLPANVALYRRAIEAFGARAPRRRVVRPHPSFS